MPSSDIIKTYQRQITISKFLIQLRLLNNCWDLFHSNLDSNLNTFATTRHKGKNYAFTDADKTELSEKIDSEIRAHELDVETEDLGIERDLLTQIRTDKFEFNQVVLIKPDRRIAYFLIRILVASTHIKITNLRTHYEALTEEEFIAQAPTIIIRYQKILADFLYKFKAILFNAKALFQSTFLLSMEQLKHLLHTAKEQITRSLSAANYQIRATANEDKDKLYNVIQCFLLDCPSLTEEIKKCLDNTSSNEVLKAVIKRYKTAIYGLDNAAIPSIIIPKLAAEIVENPSIIDALGFDFNVAKLLPASASTETSAGPSASSSKSGCGDGTSYATPFTTHLTASLLRPVGADHEGAFRMPPSSVVAGVYTTASSSPLASLLKRHTASGSPEDETTSGSTKPEGTPVCDRTT